MSIIMVTDFLLSCAYRLLRSSTVDECRERPASSIGGGVHPAVAEAGRGASPPRAGGSPQASPIWVEGDPITISDGSGGDRLLKDARSMDEEVEASPVAKRTPCPIGLHSVEEKRKKEEEERERETQQQLQEGQQQPQQEGEEGEEGRRQQGDQLEELLE